jgi:hypothetical protein
VTRKLLLCHLNDMLIEPSMYPLTMRGELKRALSCLWGSAVGRSDEENEIALSRSLLPCRRHQLRGSLVFPVQSLIALADAPVTQRVNHRSRITSRCLLAAATTEAAIK